MAMEHDLIILTSLIEVRKEIIVYVHSKGVYPLTFASAFSSIRGIIQQPSTYVITEVVHNGRPWSCLVVRLAQMSEMCQRLVQIVRSRDSRHSVSSPRRSCPQATRLDLRAPLSENLTDLSVTCTALGQLGQLLSCKAC